MKGSRFDSFDGSTLRDPTWSLNHVLIMFEYFTYLIYTMSNLLIFLILKCAYTRKSGDYRIRVFNKCVSLYKVETTEYDDP